MSRKGDAPGLEKRTNKDGSVRCYWRPERKYLGMGYTPSTPVRLVGDWAKEADRFRIIDQANRLQSQMLLIVGGANTKVTAPIGTIRWYCQRYQTDPESPYMKRRNDTRVFYDKGIAILCDTVGNRLVSEVDGIDVARWASRWEEPKTPGGKPRKTRARMAVSALKVVLAFGSMFKESKRHAMELKAVLSEMRFEGGKARRQVAMTREQCEAICAKARELGMPSVARAMAIQFWAGFRQKDIIGEWVWPDDATKNSHQGKHGLAVNKRKKRWQQGLLWGEHLSHSMVLRKPTSKSNGNIVVEVDLSQIPAVMREFEDVPPESRIGPVILDPRDSRPFTRYRFASDFRRAADAAGVPRAVWNMDARAGAVTEAFAAGAQPQDVMKAAGHTQLATTMGYHRGSAEQTSRVAKLRVAHKPPQRDPT
jgi:hypothetical protein